MSSKWQYKYVSPGFGNVHHKGNDIMIIYSNVIKLFVDCDTNNFYPCTARKTLERKI